MHFIKSIFEDKTDDETHKKLVRYSKGVFEGPKIKLKIVGKNVKINSSFHYVDEFYTFIFKKIMTSKIDISGSVIFNEDISNKIEELGLVVEQKVSSRGIYKIKFSGNIGIDELKELKKYKILFNYSSDDFSIKVKNSYPKPNKEFTYDFCKFGFSKEFLDCFLEEFLFDLENLEKEVLIEHKIEVFDVELPKKITDFETARLEAVRIGKVTREVFVDGLKKTTQKDFKV